MSKDFRGANRIDAINKKKKEKKKKQIMSKLPHVTHSQTQHERTVDIIRCQTELIWP